MNMFSGSALHSRLMSRPKSKSPVLARALRLCCQTKKNVDPGRNCHRSTAFIRSEQTLKSRSENDASVTPSPSKST